MRIVIDSREQAPYLFQGKAYEGVEAVQGSLATGDYSLQGAEHLVAVERKSLPDLVGVLGRDRERFERELMRAAGLQSFAVVVEGTWADIQEGRYRHSKLPAHVAMQSLLAFQARLRIPFFFAGNRDGAEFVTCSLLRQWAQGRQKELRALDRAMMQGAVS